MYKLIDVSKEEYDKFVKGHKYGDICQISSWADVKSPYWYSKRIVMSNENNDIVASAQLLFRKIPKINKTICYIPRGFVCDYDDINVIKAMLKYVIEKAKKEKACFFTMDPIVQRKDKPSLHEDLKKIGFKHNGFTTGFVDLQPRFAMVTDISDNLDLVFKKFNSRAKTNIKKSIKYGLSFEVTDEKELSSFYNLMLETGKRDEFSIRSKEYFEKLISELKKTNDAFLVLIKMYPKTTFDILKKEYDEIIKEIERANKKLLKIDKEKEENLKLQILEIENRKEKIKKLIAKIEPLTLENKPVVLSGAILTYCGKKAYYLYGASSNDFRELLSNYFMQWNMMEFSKNRGCTSYDFGGISGIMQKDDHEYGLFDFKRRFNSEVNEKIGQFYYILNPFVYFIFKTYLKIIKFIRKR